MTAPAGRTAVVTGANRADGIGLALVRELRARGCAPVVGTYRDPATSAALLDLAATDAGRARGGARRRLGALGRGLLRLVRGRISTGSACW